jgi:hypothetical protein
MSTIVEVRNTSQQWSGGVCVYRYVCVGVPPLEALGRVFDDDDDDDEVVLVEVPPGPLWHSPSGQCRRREGGG